MTAHTPRSPATDDIPAAALLHTLLDRISADIPGALGAAVSITHHGEPLTVLVTTGIAEHVAPAQTQLFGGPIPDAAATAEPVLTDDLFTDPRWPELTLDTITCQFPSLASTWARVHGVAALPTYYDDGGGLSWSSPSPWTTPAPARLFGS
ncbi:hypothetical protein GCM10027598_59120 [Amycolatopsis oliviviridis]|uniref:Uncharacterized protein n=1 Tax=Amycolatopsis oliviviridis TaxID=1471590 RepID=A0ABQ3M0S9_9PSEU|nr:hypothetical protein [Amycolatopsis oliviviridis]GHH28630.1 hypothetical protein GCM10017790_59770 [Amycolatopsis oliviviridis]